MRPWLLSLTLCAGCILSVSPPALAAEASGPCARATIIGTEDDDTLKGTYGRDIISGLGGDDEIRGMHGPDLICGGPGNDVIFTGQGDDEVRAGRGDDYVKGGGGEDHLRGGAGADRLYDNFEWGTCDDGGSGDDVVERGIACFGSAPGPVRVDLRARTATGHGNDRVGRVTRIIGSRHDDVLIGGRGPNELDGAVGNDKVFGRGGDDTLYGESSSSSRGPHGDDFLRGGPGVDVLLGDGYTVIQVPPRYLTSGDDNLGGGPGDDRLIPDGAAIDRYRRYGSDTLVGGQGRDLADFSLVDRGVTVDLSLGTAEGQGGDALFAVEKVRGSFFAPNVLLGDESPNHLHGGNEYDVIHGRGSNDRIWGRGGRDRLFGDSGDDLVDANMPCGDMRLALFDGGEGTDGFTIRDDCEEWRLDPTRMMLFRHGTRMSLRNFEHADAWRFPLRRRRQPLPPDAYQF